ncbi:MAG: amidase family protein [Acidimicrobiales bacterium]|jgi:amidase|nr:amidase family protein [Acidimicrobiales bacterium]
MDVDDLTERSAVELAELIRAGDVSVVEVVTAHLDRIEQVNIDVNAIVAMFSREEILAAAAAADAGEPVGPLHGLPIAVKDLDDVAGLPTRAGSLITSDRPAEEDGLVASRVRAAGAIIIGKTNTPEFGAGSHTFNEVYGLTRNPWNLDHSAGGSSGGAAAALGARMLPIADGSDLGGSLRNPAAFNNVVGLRPTMGRVPSPLGARRQLDRFGVQGPMGRTVADAALLLSALAGPHPDDDVSLPEDGRSFRDLEPAADDVRLAFGGDMEMFPVEPEVLACCESTAAAIVDVGGVARPAAPDLCEAMEVFRIARGWSMRILSSLEGWRSMKSTLVANIEYGLSLTGDDVVRAEEMRLGLVATMESFFEEHDVLALPSAQVAPFPADREFPTEINGDPMSDYLQWMTTCCVISATGCPAISIPAGFTNAGLPAGLQLVAPWGEERRLLGIAAAIEENRPFHLQRPL